VTRLSQVKGTVSRKFWGWSLKAKMTQGSSSHQPHLSVVDGVWPLSSKYQTESQGFG
jgi:hypothetical protein